MKYSLLLLALLLFSSSLFAQRPTKEINVLLIKNLTKEKVKFIEKGDKINYWIKNDKKKYKGHLDSFGNGFIVSNGQQFPFDTLAKIAGRSTGMAIMNTTGKVLIVSGTGITALGASMVIKGYQIAQNDACQALGYLIMGYITAGSGLVIVVVGAIPALLHQKRYNLVKKWYLDDGTVVVKMKRKELKAAGLL